MVVESPHGQHRLQHAGGTERMAVVALQAVHGYAAETSLGYGHRLHLVHEQCGRAVGADLCQTFNRYIGDGGL